jgi:hypothetical protein
MRIISGKAKSIMSAKTWGQKIIAEVNLGEEVTSANVI